MTWLLVGSGGAIGAMARHAINRWWLSSYVVTDFPAGSIFLINVAGSGLIGVIAGVVAADRLSISSEARTFFAVGLLEGFTTFSSFSLDTLTLMKAGFSAWPWSTSLGKSA